VKTIGNRAKRPLTLVAAAALALAVAACGSSSKTSSGSSSTTGSSGSASGLPAGMPGQGKPAITLGDKNFSEEFLLGDLYQQILQSKGYTVNLKPNLGSSELVEGLLTSGQIDMYPEYTGVIYTELANLGQTAQSAQATYNAAKQWEAGKGFTVFNPTPFQDADGVAVTNAYAKQHGLKTIGDLSKVGPFTYAGPPENSNRFQGVLGLKDPASQGGYGLTQLKFVPLTTGTQYTALDQGQVNSIAIFTTDGQLASGKYTVLTDTKGIFGYQQVVPVVSNKIASEEGPQFQQILNTLDSLLTFPAIRQMNQAVQIDQQDPAKVAHQFLVANHLVSS
jgi:osmoprotectant transport system substrate-binding protein